MTGSKKLMEGLDLAAAALLKRHFPVGEDGQPVQSNLTDPEIQIKAFTACVNWYGPRTKLGGHDEGKDEFTKLRDKLHGRGKSKRKTDNGEAEAGDANGALTAADFPAEGSA